MKIIFNKDVVKIHSFLGDIEGSSYLIYSLAKQLIDSCKHYEEVYKDNETRIITINPEIEQNYIEQTTGFFMNSCNDHFIQRKNIDNETDKLRKEIVRHD